MALGGPNDKIQGSTGDSTETGNRPSRNDRDSNPYTEYSNAMQDAGVSNASGTNTLNTSTYGDGSTHGNHNPNGMDGLPTSSSDRPHGGGSGEQGPPATEQKESKELSASETLAKIAREEWEDWKKRFQPRIEDLARQASTGELTKADIGRADQSVTRSFDRAADAETMRTNRLGIQRDGRQQAASDRMLGLNETATRASVRNNTRIAGQDRDMQILAGGGNIGLGANQ